jgi:regulator of sirC expression with transglutaminase-like and TPR domain
MKSNVVRVGSTDLVINQLSEIGAYQDKDINLLKTSLFLSLLNHTGKPLDQYENHLENIAQFVFLNYKKLEKSNEIEAPQYLSLKNIISNRFNYSCSSHDSDIFAVDLINVIDQRHGTDWAVGILYLQTARTLGWEAEGLYIPDRFLIKLTENDVVTIFDPCDDCKVLQTHDLRKIVKDALGSHAELSASYYTPLLNRDIIIRMHNVLKFGFIEDENYQEALDLVELMQLIAPDEHRLLLDKGVLNSRLNKPPQAIQALEDYIEKSNNAQDKMDAALLIQEIQEMFDLDNINS